MNESSDSVPSDLDKRVRDVLEPYLLGEEQDSISIVSNPPDVFVSFQSKSPVFNGMNLNFLTNAFSEKVFNRTWYGRMRQVLNGYERDPGDNELVPVGTAHVELYVVHGAQENDEQR